MIVADNINNTALYGFHPDFVREENELTPIHDENMEESEYAFDHAGSYLTGIVLTMVIALMVVMFLPTVF